MKLVKFVVLFVLVQFIILNDSHGCQPACNPTAESSQLETEKGIHRGDLKLVHEGKKITVKIGDDVFTTFDYGSYDKPILYPIYGPGQIGMTRNWPMAEGVEGEAHDHPHHKSMWIAHEISGVDFWGETGGSVVTKKIETFNLGAMFRATSIWVPKKENASPLLTDQTLYRFEVDDTSRCIDCTITFQATHGDFQFDDTKEGLFAIRTNPDLRLKAKPEDGVTKVFGQAINSEGVKGKDIWGKPAKWLLYYGEIDGKSMSIAMFDHPNNLRHPTTWHARDYGLVTANPFGLHHFLGKERGAGAFLVKQGESLTLRYRVDFIEGIATRSDVESRYQAFAAEKIVQPPITK